MLNSLEIHLHKKGQWHIGACVNNDFKFYTTESVVNLELDTEIENNCELIFIGRDYNDLSTSDWVCQIKTIFINQLEFPELIKQSTFISDKTDYKIIPECNYINLNGIWKINVNKDTIKTLIKEYLNV